MNCTVQDVRVMGLNPSQVIPWVRSTSKSYLNKKETISLIIRIDCHHDLFPVCIGDSVFLSKKEQKISMFEGCSFSGVTGNNQVLFLE